MTHIWIAALAAACIVLAGCTEVTAVIPVGSPPAAPTAEVAPVTPVIANDWPVIAAPYAGALPDYAKKSPDTEAAYRWAATNRAILQYFPCTCGCESGEKGHRNNWNCYVQEEKPGGEYVWDPMSAG